MIGLVKRFQPTIIKSVSSHLMPYKSSYLHQQENYRRRKLENIKKKEENLLQAINLIK
jgi:hypothetical protein